MKAIHPSPILQALTVALRDPTAVPAFTCYDFDTALAVVDAAEGADFPVILNVAPKVAASRMGQRLICALRALADDAVVPVGVQLDHASDLDVIASSVQSGADMVLADGSALSFEDNIALVLRAREKVGPDVVLEAELGGLAGDEDRAFTLGVDSQDAAGLTHPEQVPEFVERTGAQLLAVSIGNVHGKYTGAPRIRWDILERIHTDCAVPLVLHGASGIPEGDLRRAVTLGVAKVNMNTELRTAVLQRVQAQVAAQRADGENLLGLLNEWRAAAHGVAAGVAAALNAT